MHHDILRIPDVHLTCFVDRNKETTLIKILSKGTQLQRAPSLSHCQGRYLIEPNKTSYKTNTFDLWTSYVWFFRIVIIDEVLFCSLVCAIPQTIQDRLDTINISFQNSSSISEYIHWKLSETPKTNYFLEWQYLTQPWFCRMYILYKQRLQTKYSINKYCKASFFSGTCNLRVSITSPKLSPSGLSLKQLISPVTNDTLQLLLHEILLLQVVFFSMIRRWRDVSFIFLTVVAGDAFPGCFVWSPHVVLQFMIPIISY